MDETGYVHFTTTLGGIAELTPIDLGMVEDFVPKSEGPWYFFNRIFVPAAIRRQGIGTELMQQVVEWADRAKVNIFDELNPYGDMKLGALIRFNKRFGFVQTSDIKSLMYRLHE